MGKTPNIAGPNISTLWNKSVNTSIIYWDILILIQTLANKGKTPVAAV